MKYHLKGCLQDPSPDPIIVHHRTNDLKRDKISKDTATDIVNSAVSMKNEMTTVYISSFIIRKNKLHKKPKDAKKLIKKHCLTKHLLFNDDENVNLEMFNKSG